MRLTRLEISDFRILEAIRLEPGPGLNLVLGPNASGKSSLLEAVHLLCTGRSFRSRRAEDYIRRGAGQVVIHGRVEDEHGEGVSVGVEKRPRGTRIRFAEAEVRSGAELARRLPLVWIPPDSQRLVFDGADLRRRLLDWGLFHVEQEYVAVHQSYRRVLQQRNALLRAGPEPRALVPWDAKLEDIGGQLHSHREAHLARILPRVGELASELARLEVSLHYKRGWDDGLSLSQALAASHAGDAARGYTGVGPHRADLEISIGGQLAQQVVSRGEAKLLCIALWVAQAGDHLEQSGRTAVVLIDDLAAELDPENRRRVFQSLAELGAQSFVTSVSERLLSDVGGPFEGFHVERGEVKEMV